MLPVPPVCPLALFAPPPEPPGKPFPLSGPVAQQKAEALDPPPPADTIVENTELLPGLLAVLGALPEGEPDPPAPTVIG